MLLLLGARQQRRHHAGHGCQQLAAQLVPLLRALQALQGCLLLFRADVLPFLRQQRPQLLLPKLALLQQRPQLATQARLLAAVLLGRLGRGSAASLPALCSCGAGEEEVSELQGGGEGGWGGRRRLRQRGAWHDEQLRWVIQRGSWCGAAAGALGRAGLLCTGTAQAASPGPTATPLTAHLCTRALPLPQAAVRRWGRPAPTLTALALRPGSSCRLRLRTCSASACSAGSRTARRSDTCALPWAAPGAAPARRRIWRLMRSSSSLAGSR